MLFMHIHFFSIWHKFIVRRKWITTFWEIAQFERIWANGGWRLFDVRASSIGYLTNVLNLYLGNMSKNANSILITSTSSNFFAGLYFQVTTLIFNLPHNGSTWNIMLKKCKQNLPYFCSCKNNSIPYKIPIY